MIVKINRIIQNENSHALLMGFGGSGKRSCLKLAAFMQDYDIQQVALNNDYTIDDWNEFLSEMIHEIGVDKQ